MIRLHRAVAAAAFVLASASVALAQQGRIAGVIRDEQGEAVKGGTVTAEFLDAAVSPITSVADEKGRWAMVGLRAGTWMFTARAPGYFGSGEEMNIRVANQNPPLVFALRKDTTPPSALGALASKDLQAALASADALYNGQRWDQAIAAYRTILTQAPTLSVINLQIAAAYRNKKEPDGAITAYNELLKVDPNNDKARVGIAMATLEKGDVARAEQALELAAQAPGATREVFYNLGEIKRTKGDRDAAAKAYARAAELDGAWGKPRLALGRLAVDRGDTAAATGFLKAVLDVDPLSPEAAQATALLQQIQK